MERSGYDGAVDAQLSEVTIYGLRVEPSSVVVNSRSNASFTWEPENKVTPPPPHTHISSHILSHPPTHTYPHALSLEDAKLLRVASFLDLSQSHSQTLSATCMV